MTWWHRHRPVRDQRCVVGRTFVFDTCRCGQRRIQWLHRGLPWWQSTWASATDTSRQLQHVASEGRPR